MRDHCERPEQTVPTAIRRSGRCHLSIGELGVLVNPASPLDHLLPYSWLGFVDIFMALGPCLKTAGEEARKYY